MPLPALWLLIATLLPLASFTALLFWGKRLGNPLAGIIGTTAIGGSFLCAILAMFSWFGVHHMPDGTQWGAGYGPINIAIPWIPTGNGIGPAFNIEHSVTGQTKAGWMDMGLYVDSLTVTMFVMITLVATAVHAFSLGYMREDPRFPRFFTYLGLFCFSMLGLVIGGTIMQLFVFWELVGLCSYLLIGFWWEKKSASNAAIKAFVANRVGDFGFLIGFGILFYHVGNATLPHVWTLLGAAGRGGPIALPDGVMFTPAALTVMGIGLFCGAIGKSAQFPLHVWLPDAMEGPTPVSALIHAATMVAAGVYLVGRIFPILTPDAKLVIATVGLITLTIAALIAVAQSDIKKVLAYSTVSQLGYMILAMGVGGWIGGLFHLLTHAFFKALLFLGSGSVIHAAHHEQEMPQYGGLFKKIPVTAITFLIGVITIAGLPYITSGFYSKDAILVSAAYFAQKQGKGIWWIYFILPAAVAYLTSFYMMRCWTLTFAGKPRNEHLHHHAHETPVLWGPLVALALLSLVAGFVFVPTMLRNTIRETNIYCRSLDPSKARFEGFDTSHQFPLPWPAETSMESGEKGAEAIAGEVTHHEGHDEELVLAEDLVFWGVGFAFLVGMGSAYAMYRNGYGVANRLMQIAPLRGAHRFLYRGMYIDDLYNFVFVRGTRGVAWMCGQFDRHVVDGLVNLAGRLTKLGSDLAGLYDTYVVDGAVIGSGKLVWGIGAIARGAQGGRIRGYVTVMLLVLIVSLVAAMTIYFR